jgi:two-component system response regulator YesN
MFKIAIADDEPFIVKLIRQLIDCEGLGVEIVGDASDGVAALNLVREKRPDILITDIRMPSMDGIELIEEIHKNALNVRVIAISGHRRFDYAYNALKYGVEDFIVKPIKKKELNDSIHKLLRRLDGGDEIPRTLKSLERQVQRGAARLREKLIDDCLAGVLRARSLEEINEAYMCRFEPGHFTGISVRLDFPHAFLEDSPWPPRAATRLPSAWETLRLSTCFPSRARQRALRRGQHALRADQAARPKDQAAV